MLPFPTLTLALLLATPAPAQTAPNSPGRQRAANRQALRDARRTDANYKDSHLAVTRQHLRRGSSEALVPTVSKLRFDRHGSSHVVGLRHRKAKTEPAP